MALPELGSVVFVTDGSGMPLASEGVWRVVGLNSGEYPVMLSRLDNWMLSRLDNCDMLRHTTEYRVTPVLDHVVINAGEREQEAYERGRRDAFAKVADEIDVLIGEFNESPSTEVDYEGLAEKIRKGGV